VILKTLMLVDILYCLCYYKSMAKDPIMKPSALEKVNLSFEYDVTLQDAKKAIRIRTHDK
jgi:hypothetical protein